MKFKIGIAEKRVVSHEQIIGLSPSTGRTRDDHGLGNGSWAQGIPRKNGLHEFARRMVMRMVLAFAFHRGRMSCSQAAGMIGSQSIHRGQLTRFMARPRWQKNDFNSPLRAALLQWEAVPGRFIFIVDATLVSQAGEKTENVIAPGM